VLFFSVYGCMLCLFRYLFVISTSVIDCLGTFVPEMTYYMSSGTLNFTILSFFLLIHRAQQPCSGWLSNVFGGLVVGTAVVWITGFYRSQIRWRG